LLTRHCGDQHRFPVGAGSLPLRPVPSWAGLTLAPISFAIVSGACSPGADCSGVEVPAAAAVGLGGGALLGALIGSTISRWKLRYARKRPVIGFQWEPAAASDSHPHLPLLAAPRAQSVVSFIPMLNRITVVGAGNVGATTAQRLTEKELARTWSWWT